MKLACLALLLLSSLAAEARQLVYVPSAGVYIDMDTNDIYPQGGGLPIDPNTGRAILPGDRATPKYTPAPVPQQAPVPQTAPVARAAPAPLTCYQLEDRIDAQKSDLEYMGQHDPNYAAAYRHWQGEKQAYARRCR